VDNPRRLSRGVASVEVDGAFVDAEFGIELVDDGNVHRVRIVLG
jgi:cyclic beta-1,2-glucan synthetase